MIETQMWIGEQSPLESKFERIRNSDELIHKPTGGLWTSTVRDDGTSDWLDWCEIEDFYHEDQNVWWLEPRAEIDLVRIDRHVELEAVISAFDRRVNDDAGPVVKTTETFAPIDYEAMSGAYDGLHLTEDGQRNTRMTTPGLYGWDAETVLWFEWCFESIEYQGTINDYIDVHYD
jgi:hypothetical protein